MKKLLTISALSLAMGITCVGTKAIHETRAIEASEICLTRVESNLLNRLEKRFGDSTGTSKEFIASWIDDVGEEEGLNFFINYNLDPGSATYDETYVRQAKNVAYFDVLLGSYLLTDYYEYSEQYRCFSDHIVGQISTFKTYFEVFEGLSEGTKTNEDFFLAANDCYLAAINWLEECVNHYEEDPLNPGEFIEVGPTVREVISYFKPYLETPREENHTEKHLSKILKADYPLVEGYRDYFDDADLIDLTSADEILGYTEAVKELWVSDTIDYSTSILQDFLKEHALYGIFYAVDSIKQALEEVNVPLSVNYVNFMNDFGPSLYSLVDALDDYTRVEAEPVCANSAYELVRNILLFKNERLFADFKNAYQSKLNDLKDQVNLLFETPIHSPEKCKEVCDEINNISDALTIYMNFLMPLISMGGNLHTDYFDSLRAEVTGFMNETTTRINELQNVWIDQIDVNLDLLEKEIAMAKQMLLVCETNYKDVEDYARQVGEFLTVVQIDIEDAKENLSSSKLTELSNTFDTYKTIYNQFLAELNRQESLYERTRELLDPIGIDLEVLGQAIGTLSGMLLVDTENFDSIENALADVNDEVSRLGNKISAAKTELGQTDEVKALENKFVSYKTILVTIDESITSAKELSIKTHSYIDPINAAFNDLNSEVYVASGMLETVTDDFEGIDDVMEDIDSTIEEITSAIAEAKTNLGETDDIKSLSNSLNVYKFIVSSLKNALIEEKAVSEFVVAKASLLEDIKVDITEILSVGVVSPENYQDIKDLIDTVEEDIARIEVDVDEFISIHGEHERLVDLKNETSLMKTMHALAALVVEQAHEEYLVVKEVTDIYEDAAEAFNVISVGYKSEDALISDVQETIEDAIKGLKAIPTLVAEYEEEGGEVEELHTIIDKAALLVEDYEELLTDALVFATQKEYEAVKAEYEAIAAIYKLDDEKAETYLAKCVALLDKINEIKTEILARKDAVEDQEGLDAVNTLLSELRIKIEETRDDIDLRHHELAVNKIVDSGSMFEERVEAIVNNYKHNSFNFKGDLSECDALIEEMNAVIAEIDEKADSLNQDSRLTALRNKLVAHVEAVEAAKESINKTHALKLTLIIVCSVLFVFGILALLYFFGFKKRFLKKMHN